MRVLLINCIVSTTEGNKIIRRKSNYDCMIYNFARGFVANGHSVTLLASKDFKPLEDETNDFEVVYFPSRWKCLFRPNLIPFPIGIRKWLKDNVSSYDMVVASEAFQISTLITAGVCPEKLIVWQEMSLHQRLLWRLPSKTWYNIVLPLSGLRKALIVPRSETAKTFISRYSHRVTSEIVDHGANGDLLKPSNVKTDTFAVVSRLVPGKNIGSILLKFKDFISKVQYKHFVLNIIGDGCDRENLELFVQSLSIEKNVRFLGYLGHAEMSQYVSTAQALLVNTLRDLNMVSIPEAIVSGTPILMNTLPNSADFVSHNKLGIARDNWGAEDLEEMVRNYEKFHANCVSMRDNLTNVGCAKKMVDIATRYLQ